jgi:hypothetical protein
MQVDGQRKVKDNWITRLLRGPATKSEQRGLLMLLIGFGLLIESAFSDPTFRQPQWVLILPRNR